MNQPTILVTGATGNVGRPFIAGLLVEGARVRALTRHPAAAGLPPQVEVSGGDDTTPAPSPMRCAAPTRSSSTSERSAAALATCSPPPVTRA